MFIKDTQEGGIMSSFNSFKISNPIHYWGEKCKVWTLDYLDVD